MIWTPDFERLWKNWDENLILPEQQKRLKESFSDGCNPHYLSRRTSSGTFSNNETSFECCLESNYCNCEEHSLQIYQSNKVVPCKYMYRLAREIGLIDEKGLRLPQKEFEEFTEEETNDAFECLVSIIEKYDDDTQLAFLSKCRCGFEQERLSAEYRIIKLDKKIYKPFIDDGIFNVVQEPLKLLGSQRSLIRYLDDIGFEFPTDLQRTKKGTIKIRAKYDWCLQHPEIVAPIAYPDLIAVQPTILLQKGGSLLLKYLRCKFYDTIYETLDGKEMQIPYDAKIVNHENISYEYRDGIIAKQLDLYGHNRCKKYTPAREVHGRTAVIGIFGI